MNETLVMPTFEFIGKVGVHICTKSDNNPEFDLVFKLEDRFEVFECPFLTPLLGLSNTETCMDSVSMVNSPSQSFHSFFDPCRSPLSWMIS